MALLFDLPIELDFKSARGPQPSGDKSIRTFDSYDFAKNILTPASPFRFTAPGVDKSLRLGIRSGDTVELFAVAPSGKRIAIGTGFVDETDTHVSPGRVEYLITGRDTMGQLVDNAAIDGQNRVVHTKESTLVEIFTYLIQNTRIPQQFFSQQVPSGKFLFQTQPGETKINALQRYLEFANCLAWAQGDGRIVLGKPDFTQSSMGSLLVKESSPEGNRVLDARVRRNLNSAIRQIVTQLQTLSLVDAGQFTVKNNDPDMREVAGSKVGRSVFRLFSQGEGNDVVNQLTQVGNSTGNPTAIGNALSLREIARDNMKILDVEMVVEGHINEQGLPYDIDQVYHVEIEDEDVSENMYVYACNYSLVPAQGTTTHLKLCRLGTIVAYADALKRQS